MLYFEEFCGFFTCFLILALGVLCILSGNATLKEYKELLSLLKNHCNTVGRNPDEIAKNYVIDYAIIGGNKGEVKKENQEVQTEGHINKRVHQEKSGRNARPDHQPNPRVCRHRVYITLCCGSLT